MSEEDLDEMQAFQRLMEDRWMQGRRKYEEMGRPYYDENTIEQLQEELIDAANYMMVLYWELERMKPSYKPQKRG